MRDYKNIKAYQLAEGLVIEIYKATKSFPKEEIYGLTSQLRRAAVSICSFFISLVVPSRKWNVCCNWG